MEQWVEENPTLQYSTTPLLQLLLLMKLSFQLNGRASEVDCEPADTLAEVLRNTLNLNGTKVSCEVQVCGACTVLIDGAPVSACTYLAYEARGKNVTTIEGLEKADGTLHPLQQAFIDEFAFQCGYCTPGHDHVGKSAARRKSSTDPRRDHSPYGRQHLPLHRLRANRRRDPARRRHDVEGVEKVSAEKKTDFHVVNHSIPRRDGRVKVTGKAQYVADLKLIGMAYAKVLRSPYAHAKIISIDKSRAEAHPGVYCVVTGYDLDGLNPYFGHAVKDHPLLAIEKVRYAGEPVAAVVAIDERTAFEALEFIDVKYEELKGVFTPEEAMAKDAPLLHEKKFEAGALRGFEGEVTAGKGTNICQTHKIQWGDVEKAFKEAATVVEGNYYFPMTYAYAMEPYVAVADVTDQGVTIYSSAQHPFMVRHDLKSIFNLPVSKVRLIVPFVGGGYGSKSYTKVEPLTAACSWKAKRPVKLQLTVEEAMLTTRSDDAYTWMRTAADANGKIIARQAKIVMNTGAYAENSPLVVEKSTNRCVGPYAIPNVLIENCFALYQHRAGQLLSRLRLRSSDSTG